MIAAFRHRVRKTRRAESAICREEETLQRHNFWDETHFGRNFDVTSFQLGEKLPILLRIASHCFGTKTG